MSFPVQYAAYIDQESADWVLAALLAPAMYAGESLRIAGRISPLFFFTASTDTQHILLRQNPSWKEILLDVEDVAINHHELGEGVGTGFSAGIDSFATLAAAKNGELRPVTHLATINAGAIGVGKPATQLFGRYKARLEKFCANTSWQPLPIDSNVAEFYDSRNLSFKQTHTIRSASCILPLQRLLGTYYYSSGYEYSEIAVRATKDMAEADPILLPLLSTEAIQFRACGSHLSRLEKVSMVSEFHESYDSLDVCVDIVEERADRALPNCSKCTKCGRQLVSIELMGCLSKYKNVFDLQVYGKR